MASNAVHRIETDNVTHTDDHTFSGALTATGTESHTGTETHTGAVTLSGTNVLSGPTTISGTLTPSGGTIASSGTLAGTGSDQGTAAAIVTQQVTVTASDGAVGVLLPVGVVGISVAVINTIAAVLKVYARGASGTIDGGSGAAAKSQAASKTGVYRCTAIGPDTWWSQQGA